MARADIARWCAWITFPLAGFVFVLARYRHSYFYYDEWTTIDRSRGSWTAMFDGHQGHLEVFSYIVYRLQRSWFGLEGNQLVYLAFCTSLAALQLSIAAVLRKLGVPTLLALLAATVVTYFGPGAQGMSWEFMLGINFALALSFIAGRVALSETKTTKTAVGIAGLLVLACAADSGVAIFGAIFVGIMVVALWPRRLAVVALLPPLIAHLAWYSFGDQGVQISASFDKVFSFAWRLLLLSAGALVGGGETPSAVGGAPTAPTIPLSGVNVGLIALALAGACVAFGLVRHRLSRPIVACMIGGLAAAIVGVSAIAKTRAFLIVPEQFPGSRYVQWFAAFLLLAFAPAIVAAVRPTTERAARVAGGIAAIVLVAIFVVNLNQLRPARRFYEGWSAEVKTWVGETVTVLSKGCGAGQRPDPDATPTLVPSPQVTVSLVRELLGEGALTPRFSVPVRPESRTELCRPTSAAQKRADASSTTRNVRHSRA